MEVKMTTAIRPARTAPAVSKAAPAKKADTAAGTRRVDTYESSPGARAFGDSMMDGTADTGKGLVLNQVPPTPGTLKTQEFRPDTGSQTTKMDWAGVEKAFQNISLPQDRPCNVDATVRHTAALYVAAKHCLTEQYSGEDQKDILENKLKQLDSLYEDAKKRVTGSYGKSVGSFYDKYSGKGTGTAMKNSLMTAFDQKAAEAETTVGGLLDPEKGYSFDFICIALQANMIYNEEHNASAAGEETGKNESGTYSLEDLKAAAVVAEAYAQADSGQKLHLLSDEEPGIMLTLSHMKLAVMLAGTGADQAGGSQISHYQFDIPQFVDMLKKGNMPELVRSIAKGGPGGLVLHA